MLKIDNISCGYDGIDVVEGVNFSVNNGESLCIVGPNGCGKSTLLKALSNLINFKGNVFLNNRNINELPRKELASKIALMTQTSNVQFPYSIYETVALGRYAHSKGIFSSLRDEDYKIIEECIKNVGLWDIREKQITELSGGQLQRVFLARAFAQNPEVILLDEPTNHLDLKCQIEILEYLNQWKKQDNKIVIAVLHDLNLVHNFGDKVVMMKDGEVKSFGKVKDVFESKLLKEVYDIDVMSYMLNTLNKWNCLGGEDEQKIRNII